MTEYTVNADQGGSRMELMRLHGQIIAWIGETKYPFKCERAGEITFENVTHAIEFKLLFG